jgi:hypothetical protein
MKLIHVLNRTGDSETPWDVNDAASVKAAEEIFNTFLNSGFVPVKSINGKLEQTKTFDPDADSIIMHPQLIGG